MAQPAQRRLGSRPNLKFDFLGVLGVLAACYCSLGVLGGLGGSNIVHDLLGVLASWRLINSSFTVRDQSDTLTT
jgi:hypothetical protein